MKVLVIGYGSMGRRRIRIVKKIYPQADILCLDKNSERKKKAEDSGLITFDNLEDAILDTPDFAFVCTSPGTHAELILELIKHGIATFTEINLCSDKYDEIIQIARKNHVKVFMSSTLMYNKQINAIMDEIKNDKEQISYIYHVGQYLPDWHPWERYQDFFIGKKSTNGCREIFAIQLPWIIASFGAIKDIKVARSHLSSLDIDFDDTYLVTITHQNGNQGMFMVDVVSRIATTYLEVIGEHIHIKWEGLPDSLLKFDTKKRSVVNLITYKHPEHVEEYSDLIIEDEYVDEVKAFFDWVNIDVVPKYTFVNDKYVLDIIDKIEGVE